MTLVQFYQRGTKRPAEHFSEFSERSRRPCPAPGSTHLAINTATSSEVSDLFIGE